MPSSIILYHQLNNFFSSIQVFYFIYFYFKYFTSLIFIYLFFFLFTFSLLIYFSFLFIFPILIYLFFIILFAIYLVYLTNFIILRIFSIFLKFRNLGIIIYFFTEFSVDRCAHAGTPADADLAAFNSTCYEFIVNKGGSFHEARSHCKSRGGDLIHGFTVRITNNKLNSKSSFSV